VFVKGVDLEVMPTSIFLNDDDDAIRWYRCRYDLHRRTAVGKTSACYASPTMSILYAEMNVHRYHVEYSHNVVYFIVCCLCNSYLTVFLERLPYHNHMIIHTTVL